MKTKVAIVVILLISIVVMGAMIVACRRNDDGGEIATSSTAMQESKVAETAENSTETDAETEKETVTDPEGNTLPEETKQEESSAAASLEDETDPGNMETQEVSEPTQEADHDVSLPFWGTWGTDFGWSGGMTKPTEDVITVPEPITRPAVDK